MTWFHLLGSKFWLLGLKLALFHKCLNLLSFKLIHCLGKQLSVCLWCWLGFQASWLLFSLLGGSMLFRWFYPIIKGSRVWISIVVFLACSYGYHDLETCGMNNKDVYLLEWILSIIIFVLGIWFIFFWVCCWHAILSIERFLLVVFAYCDSCNLLMKTSVAGYFALARCSSNRLDICCSV